MATADMSFTIGGTSMPRPSFYTQLHSPNETNNVTLGGTLSSDFLNIRRSWLMKWDHIKYEDFLTIYNLFLAQYQTYSYPTLVFPALGINSPVKLNISPENIRLNRAILENFTLTVTEQYAFS